MNRRLVAGATLGALSQLSAAGLLLTSAWLIVRAAQHPPVLYLMVAIVSVRFFGLGRAVFRYGERLLTHGVALARMTDDRVRAYRQIDRVAPAGLPRQRRGDIVSRVVGDVTTAQDRLLRLDLPWLYAAVTSLAVVVLLAFMSPVAAAVLAAHAVVCAAFARYAVSGAARASAAAAVGARGEMSAEARLMATASRDLVAYGAAEAFTGTIASAIEQQSAAMRRTAWFGGMGSAVVLLSTGVATSVIALTAGGTAPVLAGILLLAPTALLEPLLAVTDAERLRPAIEASVERLEQLADVEALVVEPVAPVPVPTPASVVAHDLVVGWDEPLTLPLSFSVGIGEVVGIAGPSGIGKSTLALTLAKLVPPLAGDLAMGRTDYADLDGAAVRRTVGVANQDDALFDTSIRENLRIADPRATDEQIFAALDRAGLGAFVRGLPRGLDTVIGEGGGRLSGGERQRLAIARLLLGGHDVLVLDEPTEHLDQQAADRLVRDIVDLRHDHAIVLVSHSSPVLAACDRVVELRPASGPRRPRNVPQQTIHV